MPVEEKKKEVKEMSTREATMTYFDKRFKTMGGKSIGEKEREAKIVAPIIMKLVSNMLFENVKGEEGAETEEEKKNNRNLLQNAIKNEAIASLKNRGYMPPGQRTMLEKIRGKQSSGKTYLMKQNEKLKKEFTRKEIDATFATYTVLDFENIIIDIATKILSSDKKKDVDVARFVCPENNYQELFDAYTKNLISNSTIEELKGMTRSVSNIVTKKRGGRRRSTRKIMGGEVTEEQVVEIMKGKNAESIKTVLTDNILSGEFIRQFFKNSDVQKILKDSMKKAVIAMHKDITLPPEVTNNPLQGNVNPANEGSTELMAQVRGMIDMDTVKNIINSEIGENPLIIQMIYDALGNVLCKNADLRGDMAILMRKEVKKYIENSNKVSEIFNN